MIHFLFLLSDVQKGYISKWDKLWLPCKLTPPLSPLSNLSSARAMLPKEWTNVMRVLQDRCNPTPYEDLERLFVTDIGQGVHEIFDDFDPNPIGVASLAQVHVGRYKKTGQLVAVKVSRYVISTSPILTPMNLQLQHPHLAEFSEIDMETVEVAMGSCTSIPDSHKHLH